MQRQTHQKKIILDVLKTLYHPTAIDVYNKAKEISPKISLATIYRNLNQLASENKIIKLNLDENDAIYDINTYYHNHFVCTKCKKIIDICDVIIDEKDLEKRYGFEISKNHLTINGLCNECKVG